MKLGLGLGLTRGTTLNPAALFGSSTAGAWYDPSDLASMSQNSDGTGAAAVGSPVGRIMDKSGRGNHAIQATAASRPILRQDSSGKYYLEFNGVDQDLRAAFAISQPWDRTSALRQITSTDFDRIFGGFAANSGNLLQHPTEPQIYALSGGTIGVVSADATALGTNMIVTERHAGVNGRLAINNGAYVTGDTGTTATDGLSIASAGASTGARYAHIRLYGVLMIGRALTDGETQQVRRFMASRANVSF